jgi:hypothetical protein
VEEFDVLPSDLKGGPIVCSIDEIACHYNALLDIVSCALAERRAYYTVPCEWVMMKDV